MSALLDALPKTVRYVKNGAGGQWWTTAKADGQIHLGWSGIPHDLLQAADLPAIIRANPQSGARSRRFSAVLLPGPARQAISPHAPR